MSDRCTRLVERAGKWARCDRPAKWWVQQLGKEVPRCGTHARHAQERRRVKA